MNNRRYNPRLTSTGLVSFLIILLGATFLGGIVFLGPSTSSDVELQDSTAVLTDGSTLVLTMEGYKPKFEYTLKGDTVEVKLWSIVRIPIASIPLCGIGCTSTDRSYYDWGVSITPIDDKSVRVEWPHALIAN